MIYRHKDDQELQAIVDRFKDSYQARFEAEDIDLIKSVMSEIIAKKKRDQVLGVFELMQPTDIVKCLELLSKPQTKVESVVKKTQSVRKTAKKSQLN
jgi:hypothetical protein